MVKIKLKTIEGYHEPHQKRSKNPIPWDDIDKTGKVIEHNEANDVRLGFSLIGFIGSRTIGWKIRIRIRGRT